MYLHMYLSRELVCHRGDLDEGGKAGVTCLRALSIRLDLHFYRDLMRFRIHATCRSMVDSLVWAARRALFWLDGFDHRYSSIFNE